MTNADVPSHLDRRAGGSSKASYSKLRQPISLATALRFARPFSSIGRVEARTSESYHTSPRLTPLYSIEQSLHTRPSFPSRPAQPTFVSTEKPPALASRCLRRPGLQKMRIHQHKKGFGWQHELDSEVRREPPMRIGYYIDILGMGLCREEGGVPPPPSPQMTQRS